MGVSPVLPFPFDQHFRRIVGWAADDSLIWVGAYATLIAGAITSSAMPWAFTKLVETVTVPGTQMRKPILQLTAAVILGACISSVQSILFAEGATRMSVRVQVGVRSGFLVVAPWQGSQARPP